MQHRRVDYISAASLAFKNAFPLVSALIFLGIGYGIYMRSIGFGIGWPVCMATLICAGSMEFITVGLLLSTFNPLYTLFLTLLVNGRHLFYGISMLNKYKDTGWKKLPLVSFLIDEAFSLNYIVEVPPHIDRSWFMLFVTVFLYLSWVIGTTIGAVTGSDFISDIKGIEFVMPALFIVIFVSQWQKETSHGASILGFVIALMALPIFGKAYFMLPSMIVITGVFLMCWNLTKNKNVLL